MPPRVAAAAAAAAGQWTVTTSTRVRPIHRNRAGVWPPCCPAELHLSTAAAARADGVGAMIEDADAVARRMLSCARTATSMHVQVRMRCSLHLALNPKPWWGRHDELIGRYDELLWV